MTSRKSSEYDQTIIEIGRKVGLKIGRVYVEQYLDFVTRYRVFCYKRGISRRLTTIGKKIGNGISDLSGLLREHKITLEQNQKRLAANGGFNAKTRRSIELMIINESLIIDTIEKIIEFDQKRRADYFYGIHAGIKTKLML